MRKKFIALVLLLSIAPFALHAQDLFSQNEDVIPPELDRTYIKAMQYLVKTQSADGSWPGQYGTEPAVVSLAMLSLLAHGEDPNYGPYHATIHRCIDYLLKSQNSNTGYIGSTMYNHGFSTLALAESYGMVQDTRLGPALQKAVDSHHELFKLCMG